MLGYEGKHACVAPLSSRLVSRPFCTLAVRGPLGFSARFIAGFFLPFLCYERTQCVDCVRGLHFLVSGPTASSLEREPSLQVELTD